MIRMALFTLAGIALIGPTALAQSPPPEGADSRYTFHRVDDGYVRLDGRTGQVSMCAQRSVGWACQAIPDERAALEAEIARLQGESAALKKELIARRGCNCPTMPISIRSLTSLRSCGAASSK
jgi:hypothetical protein